MFPSVKCSDERDCEADAMDYTRDWTLIKVRIVLN